MSSSDTISTWIKKQVRLANKKGIIVGLSGGIDSSLVAVLAKKALGDNVLGLILPCKSMPFDQQLALRLARKFKIKTICIDLSGVFDLLSNVYPKATSIAKANLKARLRMATLYYLANSLDYLVAGTGNKSELMIGYFTKYGDGGCDILPIGSLLKSEVRIQAKKLGIPSEIITRAPTAGLWVGQTDESEIGMSYESLDSCLRAMEQRKNNCKINKDMLKRIKLMIKNSEHKRRQPQVCL